MTTFRERQLAAQAQGLADLKEEILRFDAIIMPERTDPDVEAWNRMAWAFERNGMEIQ